MIPTRIQLLQRLAERQAIIDCHTHVGLWQMMYLRQQYPYCLSFEDLAIRMQVLNIDASILFPFGSSYYLAGPSAGEGIRNAEFSTFPFEKENRSLFREIFEVFPEFAPRAIPFAFFDPSRNAAAQMELLEELAENYPLCGLKSCTSHIRAYVLDLEKQGREILAFAHRHDLPILLHSSYHSGDPWAQLDDILALARRHPEIRWCIAHSARFSRTALDAAADLPNCWVDVSALTIHCQLAAANHRTLPSPGERFDADYTNPAGVLQTLAERYPQTILWGTDTPCNYFIGRYRDADGQWVERNLRCRFDTEARTLRSLSGEIIQRIASSNALRFLSDRGAL